MNTNELPTPENRRLVSSALLGLWECKRCLLILPKANFSATTPKAIKRTCTACKKAAQYIRRKKHYEANKPRIHRREQKRGLVKGWGRDYHKRQSQNLTDAHIRDMLTQRTKIPREWITQQLIEAKRLQLKLRRNIYEKRS